MLNTGKQSGILLYYKASFNIFFHQLNTVLRIALQSCPDCRVSPDLENLEKLGNLNFKGILLL